MNRTIRTKAAKVVLATAATAGILAGVGVARRLRRIRHGPAGLGA